MVRQRMTSDRSMFFFLSTLPVLLAGWMLMGGCMPLPILDAHGVVRGTVLDPSNRMHVVIENDGGIQYGVVNGLWLDPEPVTGSGTLGGTAGYPAGAGRGVIALDPAGSPHVLSYSNGSTGWPTYLYGDLVHSWKESGVWESEVVGAVGDCALPPSVQPAIAVDGAGDVHVAYANMDCDSGDVEIRYAKKQGGLWSEELVDTVSGLYLGLYPVLMSRIALGPGGEPVIATGLGGWDFESHCSDTVIRVSRPAEGGGWETEEIFIHVDPCEYHPLSGELHDLSLALGPGGAEAVGFMFQTSEWSYVSTSYSVLVHSGNDWVADPQPLCSDWTEAPYPPSTARPGTSLLTRLGGFTPCSRGSGSTDPLLTPRWNSPYTWPTGPTQDGWRRPFGTTASTAWRPSTNTHPICSSSAPPWRRSFTTTGRPRCC